LEKGGGRTGAEMVYEGSEEVKTDVKEDFGWERWGGLVDDSVECAQFW
jgi:hypothetical protein